MNTDLKILSDREVIELLQDHKNEKEGILFLYKTHIDSLCWFVTQNNGSAEDAQDNFQEVIVSFVNLVKQNKFRGESSIKTFLFSLNRNIWFNELKRRGRQELREIKFEQVKDEKEDAVDKIIEQRESSRELLKIMDTLGESCKKILLLFYYENYSMANLVTALNYENEQVVRNKKYKCLKKLDELIHEQKDLYHQLKNLLHG